MLDNDTIYDEITQIDMLLKCFSSSLKRVYRSRPVKTNSQLGVYYKTTFMYLEFMHLRRDNITKYLIDFHCVTTLF